MKFITLIMLSIFLIQNTALAVTESANSFVLPILASEIPIDDMPTDADNGDGLSGGAVTAITLGSIGAVAIGGLGFFLYKKFIAQGLASGYAIGVNNPIMPLCLDKNKIAELMQKYPDATYLKKALSKTQIKSCPISKYILIPDSVISPKSFNSVVFEIPKGYSKMNIIQAESNKDIKLEFFSDLNQANSIKFNSTTGLDNQDVLIKQTSVPNVKTGVLVYKFNTLSSKKIETYATIIEFYN